MKRFNVIILAAGKGERMLSDKPKVMHEIMGKPMVGYVIERAEELKPLSITVVVGFGKEVVLSYIRSYDVGFAVQTEQKGTAHAVLSAGRSIKSGDVLVLYGDVPLMDRTTLNNFIAFYKRSRSITFMTTYIENPAGYGRILMEADEIKGIIEDADADEEQKRIKEINTGICIIPEEHFKLLEYIRNDNKKGEYYLTDICKVAKDRGLTVKGFHYDKSSEVLGVNGKKELLDANIIMRERIADAHMKAGVTLLDRNIYIESNVTIGRDTVIYPNTYIMGKSRIGRNVTIGPGTFIKDSFINDNVCFKGFAYIEGVEIEEGSTIDAFYKQTGK